MTIAVPTLSAAGWVRSPAEKADYLFSHFYESDKFQTYLYSNNVSNLQYLIEQFGHDIITVTQKLRSALEIYLARYYDVVTVEVTSEDVLAPTADGKITLRVFCRVIENGKEYSFGKLIVAMNSKLEKVITLNNMEV